jgi:hypothetical protein
MAQARGKIGAGLLGVPVTSLEVEAAVLAACKASH